MESFGDFIVSARVRAGITLRSASILTNINVVRLSNIERQVSPDVPTIHELEIIKKVYKIESDLPSYSYDSERHEEDREFDRLLREKSLDQLKKYGIFTCKADD